MQSLGLGVGQRALIAAQVVVSLSEGSIPATVSNPLVMMVSISSPVNAVLKMATSSIIPGKNAPH